MSLISGCAAYYVAGQVQSGRQALLVNDPERALPYFLQAAKENPNYFYESEYFREGVWTYVGRTQYATKKYSDARQSLERALTIDRDDKLARLYLGLTLVRLGDESGGAKEIVTAMKDIHDWLEYIESARPYEAYWDPLREIRKAIENDIAAGPGKDTRIHSEQLVADAEWLGNKMEDEMERVRQDRRRQLERGFEGRRGFGIGVGF